MVKTKLPPLKTEHYTKILIEIGREHPTISELAKRVGKGTPIISDQLSVLEKLNCVKRSMNRNPFYNTKEVSIDWKGLTNQYLIYLMDEQKIKILKTLIDTYSKNRYLQNLLKLVIRDHQKKYHNTREIGTMYRLFEKITMQIVYSDVNYSNKIFKRLRKKDDTFILFKRLINSIKYQKTADERKTYAKFLRGIVKEINSNRTSKKNN